MDVDDRKDLDCEWWFLACKVVGTLNKCSALAAEVTGCKALVGISQAMHVGEVSSWRIRGNVCGIFVLFRCFACLSLS